MLLVVFDVFPCNFVTCGLTIMYKAQRQTHKIWRYDGEGLIISQSNWEGSHFQSSGIEGYQNTIAENSRAGHYTKLSRDLF
jgi:hypothetical protein